MHYDIDAAIFDMDGTLLDTMRYWRYTTLEFLLAHQMPVRDEDLLRMHDTSSRKILFEIAEREGVEIGTRETVVAELEGYMDRHYQHDCHLKEPAVPDFLRKLRDSGIRLCVATGAPRQYARKGLSRVGILDFFEFVTDNYERGDGVSKNQPEYFVHVTERLNTVPEHCVVFEDALYAMKAAKAAGCRVVAIAEATAGDPEPIRRLADRYIRSYVELM